MKKYLLLIRQSLIRLADKKSKLKTKGKKHAKKSEKVRKKRPTRRGIKIPTGYAYPPQEGAKAVQQENYVATSGLIIEHAGGTGTPTHPDRPRRDTRSANNSTSAETSPCGPSETLGASFGMDLPSYKLTHVAIARVGLQRTLQMAPRGKASSLRRRA